MQVLETAGRGGTARELFDRYRERFAGRWEARSYEELLAQETAAL